MIPDHFAIRPRLIRLHTGLALMALAGLLLLLAATGCNNGDDGEVEMGGAFVTVTDAASDEITVFEVDIVSIELMKANGAVVSVLPRATTVDFAQLTDIDELLVGASVPAGIYASGVMTLDFTDATIMLVDETEPADILDADGNPLTGEVEVTVTSGSNMVVSATRRSMMRLDLDLNATATVDSDNNQVFIEPVATVRVDPADDRNARIRGLLVEVDTDAGTFTVRRVNVDGDTIVEFTVDTDSSTVFHVDGAPFTGSAGLAALAGLDADTWVATWGIVNLDTGMLDAKFVEAGLGVRGNGQDCVVGVITSRTGDAGADATVTLAHAVRYDADSGSVTFNTEMTVDTTFSGTEVVVRGRGDDFDTDMLNVGQFVACYGDLNGAGDTLDATGTAGGVCRVRLNNIFGFVDVAPAADEMTLDLRRIRLLPVTLPAFDFTGSGTDPAAYVIDLNGLDLDVDVDTPVRIRGFVRGVDDATGGADFVALTVVDRSDVATGMLLRWSGAGAEGSVVTATSSDITFDIADAQIAVVDEGFVGTTDLEETPSPSIEPKALGLRLYGIANNGSVSIFLTFSGFSNALAARLDAGENLRSVWAVGQFDDEDQVVTTNLALIVLD